MSRIGILGGSFNPLHMGHLVLAERARQALNLRVVLFVPAWQNPLKTTSPLAAEHRRAMVALAIADNPAFALWEGEILRGGPSYTFDTINELQVRYPQEELVLLMGADTLATLPQWYRAQELFERVHFGVTTRPGSDITLPHGAPASAFHFFSSPEWAVSSEGIRDLLNHGESCRYLVPEVVREYIKQNNLYRR